MNQEPRLSIFGEAASDCGEFKAPFFHGYRLLQESGAHTVSPICVHDAKARKDHQSNFTAQNCGRGYD